MIFDNFEKLLQSQKHFAIQIFDNERKIVFESEDIYENIDYNDIKNIFRVANKYFEENAQIKFLSNDKWFFCKFASALIKDEKFYICAYFDIDNEIENEKLLKIQNEIVRFLPKCKTEEDAFEKIVNMIYEINAVEYCAIYVNEDEIYIKNEKGQSEVDLKDVVRRLNISENKKLILDGNVCYISNKDKNSIACVLFGSNSKMVVNLLVIYKKNKIIRKEDKEFYGLVVNTFSSFIDSIISNRKLKEKNDDFEVIFENLVDFMFIVNLEGEIVKVNKKLQEIMKEQKYGNNIFDFHAINSKKKIREIFSKINSLNENVFTIKMPKSQNSTTAEIKMSKGVWNGEEVIIGIARDMTNRVIYEKKIEFLSYNDVLTNLPNRRFFEEEILKLKRDVQKTVAIVILDLNGLKLINDAFGHIRGDELLIKTAEIIKSKCINNMVPSRWGGDEFAILIYSGDIIFIESVCREIEKEFSKTSLFGSSLSISTGYAIRNNGEDVNKILKKAEDNMYQNKLLNSNSLRSSIMNYVKETLFAKSYETEVHAQRIRDLSKKLSIKMGFAQSQIDEMELFAMLHDIGKIGVSDQILSKPGKLNDEEWEEIKKHAQIGYRIAKSIPEIAHVSGFILSHHERYDGTGYPRGIKGDDIPLQARILSLVDAYDAMVYDRAYRKALSKEEAMWEIIDNSNSQFDPVITKLFIEILLEEN